MKSIKLFLLPLAFCASAHAEFLDGNRLLADMNGSQMRQMSAIGYVMGVSDTLQGVSICPPPQVLSGQMHDMVKQYLEDNPALRHHTADIIVRHVLSRAWPCKQSQQRGQNL